MIARTAVALFVALVSIASVADATSMTGTHAGGAQSTRYLGPPALPLTAAVVESGGGAQHFDSMLLLAKLAGPHAGAEATALTRRFGKARVSAFVVTFNHAVDDALAVATKAGVVLPAAPAYLMRDGGSLSARLYAAGTMRDGRYDVGYMLEHLVSRNIHVAIMGQLDADPQVGPARNADFHVILTSLMGDLKTQYGL